MTDCWRIEPDGIAPYRVTVDAMADLAQQRADGSVPDALILVEHPPVFTAGRSADPVHQVWTQQQIQSRGAEILDADRGGSYTFHGPGQLVGYPVLDLGSRREIMPHVRRMEEVVIRTGADLGIELSRSDRQTGVWSGDAKVCAIGVRVTHRTITLHGFGLNCDTDLSWFDAIVPCGLSDASVTTLSILAGRPISVNEVRPLIARNFSDVFDRDLIPPPTEIMRRWAPTPVGATAP